MSFEHKAHFGVADEPQEPNNYPMGQLESGSDRDAEDAFGIYAGRRVAVRLEFIRSGLSNLMFLS